MNTLQTVLLYSGMIITSLTGATSPHPSNLSPADNSGIMESLHASGINDFAERIEEVVISPNPNSGYFVLTLPPAVSESKGTIQITDLMGFPVYTSDYFPEHGNKVTVEMLGTKPGVHFLVVSSGNERLVTKFILQ